MHRIAKLEQAIRNRCGGEAVSEPFPRERYSELVASYLLSAARHGLLSRWPSRENGVHVFLDMLRSVGTGGNDEWFDRAGDIDEIAS